MVNKSFLKSFLGFGSDVDSGKSLEREIVERDKQYTNLLGSYVKITKIRNSVKEFHKWLFFWAIIAACIVILILVYKTINRLLSFTDQEKILQSIPIFVTAFVSCITSVIAIPLAIANFLFNTKEDDNIAGIIQHMQDHDMDSITLLKDRFSEASIKNGIDFSDSDSN